MEPVAPARGRFIGRENELAVLRAVLADGLEGRGRLALVSGPPGIGKSRVCARIAREAAERGASVAWAHAWEAGGAPSYWLWAQALRSVVPPGRDGEAASLLESVVHGGGRASSDGAPIDARRARLVLFEAARDALAEASEGAPLVIVLEDLHAADAHSLDLLSFLARAAARLRVLLIATYRDAEMTASTDRAARLADLLAVARHVPLDGLTAAHVALLVENGIGAAPEANVVAMLMDATSGNPLFVEEIVASLALEGGVHRIVTGGYRVPTSVREAIRSELAHVPESARPVLAIAAVIGRSATAELLAAVATDTPAGMAAALAEAVRARILVQSSGEPLRYAFAHALIRDAVYEALPDGERRSLHARVARALESAYEADPTPHLAELARHLLVCAPERGVGYAVRAAEHAVGIAAYEDACGHYERALAAMGTKDPVVRLRLGEAELAAGRRAEGARTIEAVARDADARGDGELVAKAALVFARTREYMTRERAPLSWLRRAVVRLDVGDGALRARVLAALSVELRVDPEAAAERERLSSEAVAMARRLGGAAVLAYVLDARLQAVYGPASLEERLHTASDLLELARTTGDKERALDGLRWRLSARFELGELEAADADLAEYVRLADAWRVPGPRINARARWASRAFAAGQWARGESMAGEAREIGRAAGDPGADLLWHAQMAIPRIELARHDEIAASLVVIDPERYPVFTPHALRALRLRMLLALGRADLARIELARVAVRDFADVPDDFTRVATLALFAEAAVALGEARAATRLAPLLAPWADRVATLGASCVVGAVARPLGLIAALIGHDDEARSRLEAALAINLRAGAWACAARTEYDLARSTGGSEHAREGALSAARARALPLEMTLLVAEIDATRRGRCESGPELARPKARRGVFRREGDYWTVELDGQLARVKGTRGMEYLARVLSEPGRELHALDLVARNGALPRDAAVAGGGALLDARAKAAYRARLDAIDDALAHAESMNDAGRAELLRGERDALARELARAVGLGGKDRVGPSAAERARTSVTVGIKRALTAITAAHPAAGAHLARAVRTGAFCAYDPDPTAPIAWFLARDL